MKVAQKVPIDSLVSGKQIQDEKGLRIKTPSGEVSNVRVMGRVINIFTKPDKTYGCLSIDDETGIIQARFVGSDLKLMKKAKMGDLIELVGRLRTFEEILFLIPDGFSILEDINWALLRKLEFGDTDGGGVKNEILSFIRERQEVSIEEIEKGWEDHQNYINDLKFEGEIYEPKSGILRPVE
ncbi:MAG: hypothetical protein GOV00_01975 [Candidatus Altiarchaeota archaeon]|nr:hypothetical protein [Candidatus Altiarchaeota archaeon]